MALKQIRLVDFCTLVVVVCQCSLKKILVEVNRREIHLQSPDLQLKCGHLFSSELQRDKHPHIRGSLWLINIDERESVRRKRKAHYKKEAADFGEGGGGGINRATAMSSKDLAFHVSIGVASTFIVSW